VSGSTLTPTGPRPVREERTRARAPRRRRTLVVILVLVVVPLFVLASGAAWFWWQLDPPGGPGARVEIDIERGWGVPEIGDELTREGVISSSLVFSVYTRLNGDTDFEAGTYALRKNMGVRPAVKALKAGPVREFATLTVPPGLWLREIADRVARLPGRDADAFLQAAQNNAVRSPFEPEQVNSLEGLLWPDTYKISAEEDEIKVLKTMSDTFVRKVRELNLANANVQGYEAYDVIKIASLVEAEAKTEGDRPLIASVVYNRLRRRMPLQIDATLIYARGDPTNRGLSDADKQIDSPYNTYARVGLPPTPIAAPSMASLRAALAPAVTDFLYYVVIDEQGNHAFARTLEEHEQNIESARRAGVL
jgi:UPF0755 protein